MWLLTTDFEPDFPSELSGILQLKNTQSGVKIMVNNRPKMDQISKIATHFLVWSDIFQIREGLVYTVVLTCVVGLADITTFSVAGRLTMSGGATLHYTPLCK